MAAIVDFSKKEKRMLWWSLHDWENFMVGFLIVAGLFALFAGVATWVVVKLQRFEIARSEQELDRYKMEAGERIKGAESRAAEAEAQAARVEQAARWRIIDSAKLASALSGVPGSPITLSWSANDPESLFLAKQIENAFEASNLKNGPSSWILTFQPRVYSRAIFWDVRIIGPSELIVGAVRDAFANAGIPYSTEPIPNILNDSPGLVIGAGDLPAALIWVGPRRPLN